MNTSPHQQHYPASKLSLKGDIPQSTRESLMSMMREIMEKSYMCSDELYYIAEESVEESGVLEKEEVVDDGREKRLEEDPQFVMGKDLCGEQYMKVTSLNNTNVDDKGSSTFQQKPINHNHHRLISHESNFRQQSSSSSSSSTSHEFSKLIDITQRCVNYYNSFLGQKSSQLSIIQKTFKELNNSLSSAFEEMVSELLKKQNELRCFLMKKYEEIVSLRQGQDSGLKQALSQIKQVHLVKLMANGRKDAETNQFITDKEQNQSTIQVQIKRETKLLNSPTLPSEFDKQNEISVQLHNYAQTLNRFYTLMDQIEKSNFRQMVEESVNFINNLITEEIKVTLYQNIPSRLTQKCMIRERSKDFLLQADQNSFEVRTHNFDILDVDSFTKLFNEVDQSYKVDRLNTNNKQRHDESIKTETNKKLSVLEEISTRKTSIIEPKLKPSTKINPQDKSTKAVNTELKKSTQKITQSEPNNLLIKKNQPPRKSNQHQSHKQSISQSNRRNSITSKVNFNKKEPYQIPYSSPLKNTVYKDYQERQKQNQLQLIKKISNQQSNRSAKIKGYLVTFQDSKNNLSQSLQKKRPQTTRATNNSKSPVKTQKTPTKLNKSTQKKPLTSSVGINALNQQKFRNTQQYSLQSSRNSAYVSQFKIVSSRRQSLANNK